MQLSPSFRTRSLLLASCLTLALAAAANAQVSPFRGTRWGPHLTSEDNRLLNESVARLNASEPAEAGHAESWQNPRTKSSGTSTVVSAFDEDGMACRLVRHHIVAAGREPGRTYRLTWCKTPSGDWKIKS